MRLLAEESLLMVVDYQERLMPVMAEPELLLKRSQILIAGLTTLGVPMLVTRQYPKGLGDTVESIRELTLNVPVFDKSTFSCFADSEVRHFVEATKRNTIFLCGIEAHICVLQTLIDLKSAGYTVVVVSDCVASRGEMDKKIALQRAVQEGALLTTYESILFELTQKAGSEAFKVISTLVK